MNCISNQQRLSSLLVSELRKYISHHKLAPERKKLNKKALQFLVESHISSCLAKEALQEGLEKRSRAVGVSDESDEGSEDSDLGSESQSDQSDEEVLDVLDVLEDPESETSGDEKELVHVKSVSTSRSGRPLQSSRKSRFVDFC